MSMDLVLLLWCSIVQQPTSQTYVYVSLTYLLQTVFWRAKNVIYRRYFDGVSCLRHRAVYRASTAGILIVWWITFLFSSLCSLVTSTVCSGRSERWTIVRSKQNGERNRIFYYTETLHCRPYKKFGYDRVVKPHCYRRSNLKFYPSSPTVRADHSRLRPPRRYVCGASTHIVMKFFSNFIDPAQTSSPGGEPGLPSPHVQE